MTLGFLLTPILLLGAPGEKLEESPSNEILQRFDSIPLHFEENRGQLDERVSYVARGLGYQLLLTPEERKRGRKQAVLEKARIRISTSGIASALGLSANSAWCVVDLTAATIHAVANRKLASGRKVKMTITFENPTYVIHAEGAVRYCERNLLSLEPRYPTEIELGSLSHDDEAKLRLVLQSFDSSNHER